MTYTTSIDEIVRKKTIGVFLIFTFVPLFNLFHSGNWIWYVSFFAFFMLLLFTYLLKPIKYEVDNNQIIIHRLIGKVQINIQAIARVDRIHHDLLKNSTKGGAFGYFGKFNTYLGKTTWYGTRRDKIVLITKNDNSKIVLTPDQWDEFIEQLEKQASSQH
jgi:hypothetical protein